MATERIQLNLRLDGRPELLDAIKSAAAAKNLSINAFVISALESSVGMASSTAQTLITEDLELTLDKMLDAKLEAKLDKMLASKLAKFEERVRTGLGELAA